MSLRLNHIQKHLQALGYQDGDTVCLRAFSPTGKGNDKGRKADFTMPHIPTDQLAQWQAEGRGIYVVVNPGGHRDADITQCRAVFYEHDTLSKEVSQSLWQSLGLPEPTVQVDTGGKSVHSYWVLDSAIAPDQWRSLQTSLLEYADADRSLKNPSRVMRLAGCLHAETKQPALIVGGNGQRVPVSALGAIPAPTQPQGTLPTLEREQTWTEFDRAFRLPIPERIPLDICLARESRDLLSLGATSNRNATGAKLARDLLGVSRHLRDVGQQFDGDPYQLFLGYCARCPSGGGWNQAEWDSVWKSAQSKAPGPSVSPDRIENCIKAWAWKQRRGQSTTPTTAPTSAPAQDNALALSDADSLRALVRGYIGTDDPFEKAILQAKANQHHRISPGQFQNLLNLAEGYTPARPMRISDFSADGWENVVARAEGRVPPGIACGLVDLDGMTQGFQPSDLIVVAGRPSMGKSAFTAQIAYKISHLHNLPTVIFSLEMDKIQVLHRLWAAEAGVESNRLRSGQLSEVEWASLANGVAEVAQVPLYIEDDANPSVEEIERCAQEIKDAHGGNLGAIVIDYLQLMDCPEENRVNGLGRITRSLKQLARKLRVPIFLLSQLSRGVESRQNKRPMMSDLRDSGNIEQDADIVLMLYRDEYYNPDTADRAIAEVIISKHRNGPTGTLKLLFEPHFSRFRNLRTSSIL